MQLELATNIPADDGFNIKPDESMQDMNKNYLPETNSRKIKITQLDLSHSLFLPQDLNYQTAEKLKEDEFMNPLSWEKLMVRR